MPPRIPLTRSQEELISEFYSLPIRRLLLTKQRRDQVWRDFKAQRRLPSNLHLEREGPALVAELEKAVQSGRNIQSAVFSECVYAQALADHFSLTEFTNYTLRPRWLTTDIEALLASYNLFARYIYSNAQATRMLIQAGGHGGVDGALISVVDRNVYTIEFKEPSSKTSEPDLPKYGEDGLLTITDEWRVRYPQFVRMVEDAKGLNFFDVAGSNYHDFLLESIQVAVTENYSGKKFADVICTEDDFGNLAMIPSNQAGRWADTKGEIRPAGRNHYEVWTPGHLAKTIESLGGTVHNGAVQVPLRRLATATARGGGIAISRYKISPLYFVRAVDVVVHGGAAEFSLANVKQLKPTIAAHMFFRGLNAASVRDYYLGTE
ncbi:hypothetical protein KKR89_16440 [Cellulomonas dongxiuzhuiae]|uniref:Uncharacterized protein n=1 Tax=Cellulomonas dongxiuzhuiae TaxID=2819979 RepID=A0ABX8GIS6_9CELL|nr:hypothetical protein [Cellulomonas dongxiuzhuiae]QWC15828.1 hypothetical protein KKR89_16440 [Cellulomonas dongxiuzhuiae]